MKRIISLLAVLVLLFSAAFAESSIYDVVIDVLNDEYASEADSGILYDFRYNEENDAIVCYLTFTTLTTDMFNAVSDSERQQLYDSTKILVSSISGPLREYNLNPLIGVYAQSASGDPLFASINNTTMIYDAATGEFIPVQPSYESIVPDIIEILNTDNSDSVYSFNVIASTLFLTQKMNTMTSDSFAVLPNSAKQTLYIGASEIVKSVMDYLSAFGIADPYVFLSVISSDDQILYSSLNGSVAPASD